MPTPLQQAQAALDSGQMTTPDYLLAVKQINDAAKSGLPVTAPAPAAAPTAPAPAPDAGGGAPVPPGVTPSVWAQLSPGAQAVAAARIAQQGHPFTPGSQPPRMQPGTVNENGGGLQMPGTPPVPAPGQARNIDTGTGASGPAGVTAPQSADDPAAGLLRPGVAGPGRRVGFSDADKGMLGSLREQGDVAQTDAARQADAVAKIANTFADNSTATVNDSKAALIKTQEQQEDNARRARELAADAKSAQSRIDAKLADLQASGIDPSRYFHNQTTGQQILGALAVGFGALGAHALGPNGHDSQNTALGIMNDAIARDVESQKANMQTQLAVLGKRMDLNTTGFDQQKALLEAERDSIQTAGAVTQKMIADRAAQFKENADVQMNATKLSAGIKASTDERVGTINAQIYAIQKNAERVVAAPGGDIAKKIQDLTTKYREQADAAGENPTSAQLHQKVLGDLYGVAGGAPSVDISKPQKGPKTEHDAKAQEEGAALDAAISNIDNLIKARTEAGGGSFSAEKTGAAKTESLAARTNIERGLGARVSPALLQQFKEMVPDDPLQHHILGAVGSDPTMARLQQAKAVLQNQRNPGGAAAAPPPAGFTPRSSP